MVQATEHQTTARDEDLRADLEMATYRLEQLQENMAQLELQREDAGWKRLTENGQHDMSRDGIIQAAELHRVMAIANPLIRRGLYLTAAYTVGGGVGTTAEHPEVNKVVQSFLDDPTVRKVWAGAQAQETNKIALGTDGNIFYALPTNPLTGEVTIRDIPMDEVTQIITAPGDRETVQYFVREWSERDPHSGRQMRRTTAYPELRYRPITRQRRINIGGNRTAPVQWDVPVYHETGDKLKHQQWGTALAFSTIPWARAYTEFLDSWTKLMKALSRIAFKVTAKKPSHSQQARGEISRMAHQEAGSNAVLTGDTTMEPMPKTGATIDAESARPLGTMVAAGFMLPVTTLMSDPGQTGARAVAETLNLPTRLWFGSLREKDRETRRQILEYRILQAVKAPRGPLRRLGTIERIGDIERAVFTDPTAATLTIDYPELDDTPVETLVNAIVSADSTGKMPALTTLERLLRALRIRDVDEVLDSVKDANGNFVYPDTTTAQAAGSAAADALRRGGNPADYL